MFGFKRIAIAAHERGLLLQDRSLIKILPPGVYRLWQPWGRRRIQVCDLGTPPLQHPQAVFWLTEQAGRYSDTLRLVVVQPFEVGIVYYDGVCDHCLPPGSRRVYWQGPVEVRVEVQDIRHDYRLPERLAAEWLDRDAAARAAQVVIAMVPDQHLGLLRVNGVLQDPLPPGRHAFWRFQRQIEVRLVDLRIQTMEVNGQEILTKDRVSLRVNLSAEYCFADAQKAHAALGDPNAWLYRALQLALRQAIGGHDLDTLLADKDGLNHVVLTAVVDKAAAHGLKLVDIGLKDIVLPGEMREILNQVVMAEKQAQANIIRRREETAATRSLLNTAKLMDDHPTLLRLKELEALETILGRVEHLSVYDGLEGLLKGLARIQHRISS